MLQGSLVEEVSLVGRVACVTAAAGSDGRAVVESLARAGAKVYAIDVDGDALMALVGRHREEGRAVFGAVCDVADGPGINEALAFAIGEFGRVDLLVNLCGSSIRAPLAELNAVDWADALRVDLGSIFETLRCAMPGLSQSDRAVIVNVIDDFGVLVAPTVAAAPRAAALHLTRAMARELAAEQVEVFGLLSSGGHGDRLAMQILRIASAANNLESGSILRADGAGWHLVAAI